MSAFLIFLFVLVCFSLILVILLQSSKGGGLAGAFGGGDTMGAVFGGRGAANFLSKTTAWLAVAFLGIALLLSFINRGGDESQSLVGREQQRQGSVPAAGPAAGLPVVPTGGSQDLLPLQTDPSQPAESDSGSN